MNKSSFETNISLFMLYVLSRVPSARNYPKRKKYISITTLPFTQHTDSMKRNLTSGLGLHHQQEMT